MIIIHERTVTPSSKPSAVQSYSMPLEPQASPEDTRGCLRISAEAEHPREMGFLPLKNWLIMRLPAEVPRLQFMSTKADLLKVYNDFPEIHPEVSPISRATQVLVAEQTELLNQAKVYQNQVKEESKQHMMTEVQESAGEAEKERAEIQNSLKQEREKVRTMRPGIAKKKAELEKQRNDVMGSSLSFQPLIDHGENMQEMLAAAAEAPYGSERTDVAACYEKAATGIVPLNKVIDDVAGRERLLKAYVKELKKDADKMHTLERQLKKQAVETNAEKSRGDKMNSTLRVMQQTMDEQREQLRALIGNDPNAASAGNTGSAADTAAIDQLRAEAAQLRVERDAASTKQVQQQTEVDRLVLELAAVNARQTAQPDQTELTAAQAQVTQNQTAVQSMELATAESQIGRLKAQLVEEQNRNRVENADLVQLDAELVALDAELNTKQCRLGEQEERLGILATGLDSEKAQLINRWQQLADREHEVNARDHVAAMTEHQLEQVCEVDRSVQESTAAGARLQILQLQSEVHWT